MREQENDMSERYNGWANYETWNVALWIGNDEGLYSLAKDARRGKVRNQYAAFVEMMKEFAPSEIAYQTPDGVAWEDSGLDTDELDEMMEEL